MWLGYYSAHTCTLYTPHWVRTHAHGTHLTECAHTHAHGTHLTECAHMHTVHTSLSAHTCTLHTPHWVHTHTCILYTPHWVHTTAAVYVWLGYCSCCPCVWNVAWWDRLHHGKVLCESGALAPQRRGDDTPDIFSVRENGLHTLIDNTKKKLAPTLQANVSHIFHLQFLIAYDMSKSWSWGRPWTQIFMASYKWISPRQRRGILFCDGV